MTVSAPATLLQQGALAQRVELSSTALQLEVEARLQSAPGRCPVRTCSCSAPEEKETRFFCYFSLFLARSRLSSSTRSSVSRRFRGGLVGGGVLRSGRSGPQSSLVQQSNPFGRYLPITQISVATQVAAVLHGALFVARARRLRATGCEAVNCPIRHHRVHVYSFFFLLRFALFIIAR